MLYKVLIVDDEKWTQMDLKNIVPWNDLGFEIVGFASDVNEAKEKIDDLKPDLMCLDIMMPGVNGLEFLKYLRERKYDIITILISAYAEFKYAKQAISYGAFEYLLKPVDEEEFTAALKKTKGILDDVMGVLSDDELVKNSEIDRIRNIKYSSEAVNEALEYVEHHYTERLMISDIAERLHLNSSYFGNLFKKATGISFTGYLTGKKLEKSEELLKNMDYSISEVSDMVGYEDNLYFSKIFKKHKGISPSEYRKLKCEDKV